jgi:hypothetical protein
MSRQRDTRGRAPLRVVAFKIRTQPKLTVCSHADTLCQ